MRWLGLTGVRRIPDLQWMSSHHVLFPATDVTSMNVDVERDGRILQAPAHHWIHFFFSLLPSFLLFFLPCSLPSSYHFLQLYWGIIDMQWTVYIWSVQLASSHISITTIKTVNYPSPTNVSSWLLVVTTSHPYLPLPQPQTGANPFFCH